MRLWFVKIGEPWPTDDTATRLNRTGIMAQQYARGGDDVVWISDVFDHNKKAQRFDQAVCLTPEPRLTVMGLYGPGYPRNVSLRRFGHHSTIAAAFRSKAADLEKPDVIVASCIPLELALECVRYGRAHRVPVVVDIRDMWPDAWISVMHPALRPAAGIAILPYRNMLREIVREATALCGITQDALDWGLRHAGREQGPQDKVLPLAYAPPPMPAQAVQDAERFWTSLGVDGEADRLTACFIGTFTKRVEFDTIIEAARRLEPELRRKILFVFCGSGELDQELRERTKDLGCFLFPGWLDAVQLAVLMRRAQIGLLPYPSDPDFMRSLPNKVFDYLAGALPILTCLKGNVEKLIGAHGCGWMYGNGDPDGFNEVLRHLVAEPSAVTAAGERAHAASLEFDATQLYSDFRSHLLTLCDIEAPDKSRIMAHS